MSPEDGKQHAGNNLVLQNPISAMKRATYSVL